MTAQINTITVTTEAYLAGKKACQDTLSRYCGPNWRLVHLLGRDFEIGFQNEYYDLTAYGAHHEDDECVAKLAGHRLSSEW